MIAKFASVFILASLSYVCADRITSSLTTDEVARFIPEEHQVLFTEEDLYQLTQLIPSDNDLINGFEMIDFQFNETDVQDDDELDDQPHFLARNLQSDSFNMPLECNSDILDQISTGTAMSSICTTTFTSVAQTASSQQVLIPCGQCVTVDITTGDQLELPHGLQIDGILYFPPSANVQIRTTHVFVLGMLKIDTPNPSNQVKFTMFGEEDAIFTNTDNYQTLAKCLDTCNFGAKAIVVIGGQLDIQGVDPNCPSWEKLEDVARYEIPIIPPVDYGNILPNGDFENGMEPWSGFGNAASLSSPGYGGVGSAGKATGRTVWVRGIRQLFFGHHRNHPFDSATEWIFNAKVKLYDEATGAPSPCRPDAQHLRECPQVSLYYYLPSGIRVSHLTDPNLVWTEGEWNEITITVPREYDDWNIVSFNVNGGKAGTVLELDDASLTAAPSTLAPSPSPQVFWDALVVSPTAAECWGVEGTEILITSHTHQQNHRQVVTVESVDVATGTIQLTDEITKPITKVDDPVMAVEVASLTRRVVFEAESDEDDELIGGHLMVFWTPAQQRIEGVEIRNFGQQGRLGRYPTHFHFCGTSSGSTMKKNVVRDSNQRCYVLHQTDEVLVEDNVAFGAFGHCYFLEDGVEVNNTFRNNLAADVRKATRLLSELSGRRETDDLCSCFWISNPTNYFVGNVAAGSESTGFWFETPNERRTLPLGSFDDNQAHSTASFGFASYPPGWSPTERTVINNISVYRCYGTGMFLHGTRLLTFEGGLVADNRNLGVRVLKADDIIFKGTKFAAIAPWVPSCGWGVHGIAIDTTKFYFRDYTGTIAGTTLIDVEFTDYARCHPDSQPVAFETAQLFIPSLNAPHYFSNVKFDAGTNALDACPLGNQGVDDIIIEIVEDPSQTFSPSGRPGFLVSPKFSGFVGGSCTEFSGCMDYCEDVCLRTLTVLVNPAAPANIEMVVTSESGETISLTKEVFIHGNPIFLLNHGVYNVAVPPGSITITFVDENGNEAFPDYAVPVFETPPYCEPHSDHGDVSIVPPSFSCDNLIRNGEFDTDVSHFNDFFSGITWNPTGGVGSSGALETTTRGAWAHNPRQFLNVACLEEGDTYDFSVSFRLIDSVGNHVSECAGCAQMQVHYTNFDIVSGTFEVISAVNAGVAISDEDAEGFRVLSGSMTLTAEQADADQAQLTFIAWDGTVEFVLDNLRATKRTGV